jgi:hypothetical protein
MDKKIVLIGVIIALIVILYFFGEQENADSVSGSQVASTEAVANIAKVYADSKETATFNNIKITGNVDVTGKNINAENVTANVTGNLKGNVVGNLTGSITSPNGNYKLSIDNNGRLNLIDSNGTNVNIIGNYTGRFFSPKNNYFFMVHNSEDYGIIQGYAYDSRTKLATIGTNLAHPDSRIKNVEIPPEAVNAYNDIRVA